MKSGRENDRLRLSHMLTAARMASQLVSGEAANQLTEGTKRENHHIPWIQIVGMRHRLVHDYSAVNIDVLWDTVIVDIPHLITELQRILEDD